MAFVTRSVILAGTEILEQTLWTAKELSDQADQCLMFHQNVFPLPMDNIVSLIQF